ncbi:winged helix-turn-helix domain-containing protein [Halomarina ordinaria]|uniref:ArsR family transcriptional regulator n=1 Tax=Halomarina ordinaria TaxID=3033939 RepID=A0ABD5UF97_9EURY|nr:helix-turn-helix domain-containing protein [Halomarina sp. PSRA2]
MDDTAPSDSPITVDRRPPGEVFALLGNDLRVDVLRALAEAGQEPRTFSALRERVGERDSGKFNYHLGKLVGPFVRREADGYALTLAGQQVVGALLAGTYTAEGRLETLDVHDPCPVCEATPLAVSYEDDHVTIECPACEEWYNYFSFPPGTLDQYDPDELPEAFDRWMYTLFGRITAGFCASCAGRVTGRLEPEHDRPSIAWACDRCGDVARVSASVPLLYHPATLGFLYDHGVDTTRTPSWRLLPERDVAYDVDADGVTVTLTLDGESLTGHVDERGRVAGVERADR